ncbi:hypothetical protein NCCP2716_10680 [Sporosarcina sp. NCCP-2716]|uniref:hypothetical protein n=1 Tax=Sporosarcina sp. NCCP-2716 TaxID=2943679 RepID=UPI00203F8299|nr:hypothetical protein [Sporosarcina sp. NCCP-2716]GKV68570.1 hypothetical protein NCCP2716_10680 [Sporosarcina sp. NCCP-2716]
MTNLTAYQLTQLHSNGVYTTVPEHPLITLAALQNQEHVDEFLTVVQAVSGSPNKTVAASFFMRRYGMFTAMQLWQFISYEELWHGRPEELVFGAVEEFGNRTVSAFPLPEAWGETTMGERNSVVRGLLQQIHSVIESLRSVSSISAKVLWENVFGFWLWQFHVLMQSPETAKDARLVLDCLKEDASWEGVAGCSEFARYLQGCEPSQLLNTVVRKTCCLSKDVPGLMQCGFCPLKR